MIGVASVAQVPDACQGGQAVPQHKLFTVALLLGASLLAASGRAQGPAASSGTSWDLPRSLPLLAPPRVNSETPPPGPIRRVVFTDAGWTEPGGGHNPAASAPTENGKAGLALVIQVAGPETAAPGVPAAYQILVRNAGSTPLVGVRLEQQAPEGLKVTVTDPPALLEQHRLVWQLGTLDAGAERKIKLELIPGTVRELTIEPTATFTGSAVLRTRIPQQPLTVSQVGPDSAERGNRVVIQIRVTNNSETPLTKVMVRDELSAGFRHPQGSRIETQADTLAPGQTITVPLEVETVQSGQLVNEVMVWAREGQTARSRWSLTVNEPALRHHVTAPREAVLGAAIDVQIDIRNAGQSPVRKLRLVFSHSEGLEVTALSAGGKHDRPGRAASWQVEALQPGQTLTLAARLRGLKPGEWAYQTQLTAEGSSPGHGTGAVVVGLPAAVHEGTVNK